MKYENVLWDSPMCQLSYSDLENGYSPEDLSERLADNLFNMYDFFKATMACLCTYMSSAHACMHSLLPSFGMPGWSPPRHGGWGFIPLKQQQLGVEWIWFSPDNSYCGLVAAALDKQEGAGFSFVKRIARVSGFAQMRTQWKEKCACWNSFVRQLPVLPSSPPTASWDATEGFKWRNDRIPLPPSFWCLITVILWPLFPLNRLKRGNVEECCSLNCFSLDQLTLGTPYTPKTLTYAYWSC